MTKVIDLQNWKNKREISRGRTPLYVSHLEGKVTGSKTEGYEERVQKVRESIERINNIMKALKNYDKEK